MQIRHAFRTLATTPHVQMKSNAKGRYFGLPTFGWRSELFEIAAVAHRDDDSFRRHHQPASVLPLDFFNWPEAGQRRTGNDLKNIPVTLHIDVAVTRFADRPIRHNRQPRGVRFGCYSWLG